MTNVTKIAPALASGLDARDSANCARSLRVAKAPPAPVALDGDPQPKAPKAKATKVKPVATKPAKAPKAAPAKVEAPKAKPAKIILKGNAPIRAQLKEAAQSFGGSRLQPVGFDSFSAFLNGVPLDVDGNAEVTFVPIKGSDPITGCNVKLTVKGGVPSVSKTGKAK